MSKRADHQGTREELEQLVQELLELHNAVLHSPLPPRFAQIVERAVEALQPR